MQLRPYQDKLVQDIRHAFGKSKRVLAVLATGGGKTMTFAHIGHAAIKKKSHVWFVAHRSNLLDQIGSTLTTFDIQHGYICGKKPKQYYFDAQVCGIDSIRSRTGKLKEPDLIILDEAHHAAANSWIQVLESYPNAYVLGVTATPCRSDGKGLGDIFQEMVLGPSYGELVNMGYLVDMEIYKPKSNLDLSTVKIRMGDYVASEAEFQLENSTIYGDMIDYYRDYSNGKPGLVFNTSVKRSLMQAQRINESGIISSSVDGGMDSSEIREIISDFGAGKIQILNSCNLISEGTDIPSVFSVFMLRPTQSEALYLQMCGRASRPIYAPGYDLSTEYGRLKAIEMSEKPYAMLFDHVCNTKTSAGGRHLPPIIDRDWELNATKKKVLKGEKITIDERFLECCGRVWGIEKGKICPVCKNEVNNAKEEIQEKDGILEKVSKEEILQQKKADRMEQGRSNNLEALYKVQQSKGHSIGWIKYVFIAKVLKDTKRTDLAKFNNKWGINSVSASDEDIKTACITAYNLFLKTKR